MRPLHALLLAACLASVTTLAAAPTASAGHEDCDYHYPELQRACLLANWWHWCLQQIWWGQPCLKLGLAAPTLP